MKNISPLIFSFLLLGWANARTWVVPSTEYPHIQAGIDSASSGDTVLVLPGVYDTTNVDSFPIIFKNGIIVMSEAGADSTIIDGEFVGRTMVFQNLYDTTTILQGFTIKHSGEYGILCSDASPTILDNIIIENTYNGVYCEGGSLVNIRGNKFSKNNSPDVWAGYGAYVRIIENEFDSSVTNSINLKYSVTALISHNSFKNVKGTYPYIHAMDAYITISENEFDSCRSNCICLRYPSEGVISGNSFKNNFSVYPPIFCGGGTAPQILDNLFENNRWGIWLDTANATISGNTLRGIQRCGIVTNYSQAYIIRNLLVNCGFAGATDDGAIDCDGSLSTSYIINNTLADNRNGIICYNSATPTIRNNIIVNNQGNGIHAYAGAAPSILFNCVWNNGTNYNGCVPGPGDISLDPLFVTGPGGEYYLSHIAAGQATNSPCIDAGDTTAEALGLNIYTTRTDTLHDVGIVDMGYHYKTTDQSGVSERTSVKCINTLRVYPNPFGIRTFIEFHTEGYSSIELNIYNISGRLVKNLFNCSLQGSTFSSKAEWKGIDNQGNRMPNGIYFAVLKTGRLKRVQKIILLK